MTLKESRALFRTQLNNYSKKEIDAIFYGLINTYFGLTKISVVLQKDLQLSSSQLSLLESALQQLKNDIPLQYITGTTSFCGLKISVSPEVLIPRPETEELIEWLYHSLEKKSSFSILDMGTGSGCIAIALAKYFEYADVTAIDISKGAIKMAKKNAQSHGVTINFLEQDIFANISMRSTFDVIISNPPYVRMSEKQQMKPHVLDYEPHSAIFVDDNNPLCFYRRIIELSKSLLNKKGTLFFEINEEFGQQTVSLLSENGYHHIQLKKDFFEKDRFVSAKYK